MIKLVVKAETAEKASEFVTRQNLPAPRNFQKSEGYDNVICEVPDSPENRKNVFRWFAEDSVEYGSLLFYRVT